MASYGPPGAAGGGGDKEDAVAKAFKDVLTPAIQDASDKSNKLADSIRNFSKQMSKLETLPKGIMAQRTKALIKQYNIESNAIIAELKRKRKQRQKDEEANESLEKKRIEKIASQAERLAKEFSDLEDSIEKKRISGISSQAERLAKEFKDLEDSIENKRISDISSRAGRLAKEYSDIGKKEEEEKKAIEKSNEKKRIDSIASAAEKLAKEWQAGIPKRNEEDSKQRQEEVKKQEEFLKTAYGLKNESAGREDVYGLKDEEVKPLKFEKSPLIKNEEQREANKPLKDYKEEKAEVIPLKELFASGAIEVNAKSLKTLSTAIGAVTKGFQSFTGFLGDATKFVAAINPGLVARLAMAFKDLYATIGFALQPVVQAMIAGIRTLADFLVPISRQFAPIFASLSRSILAIFISLFPTFSVLLSMLKVFLEVIDFVAKGIVYITEPLIFALAGFAVVLIAQSIPALIVWVTSLLTTSAIMTAGLSLLVGAIGFIVAKIFGIGRSMEFKPGSSIGAGAKSASYTSIEDYGKSLMQGSIGGSTQNAAMQTAQYTKDSRDFLEKISNRGDKPRQDGGKGVGAQPDKIGGRGDFGDDAATWVAGWFV